MKFALPNSIQQHRIAIICSVISLVGLAVDWWTFYPGFMSPDSLDQFTQSYSKVYTDWHPPMMSLVWSIFSYIKAGPQPMLFLQLALLWGSFFLLLRLFLKHYPIVAILVVLFAFAPYVQNFAGNVWKDVHMSVSWFAASMIMINALYEERKMTWPEAIFSFLAIGYGCWLRINALPGGIPLLAFWLTLVSKSTVKGWRQFLYFSLKTIGLTVLVVAIQFTVTKLVVKPAKSYIEYKLFVQDLSGIYLKTGDMVLPDFITKRNEFDTVYLRAKYNYHTFDQFWWNEDNKFIFPFDLNEEKINETRQLWLGAIKDHPLVYFKIKGRGFLDFLRITNSGTRMCTFFPYIHPNDFGFVYRPNTLGNYFLKWMYFEENSFYMKPWFWALMNLILIGLSFIKPLLRIRLPLLSLSLSSIFYLAFEFFVFPADTEFRYFYWNCIAVSVGCLFATGELIYTLTHLRKNVRQA